MFFFVLFCIKDFYAEKNLSKTLFWRVRFFFIFYIYCFLLKKKPLYFFDFTIKVLKACFFTVDKSSLFFPRPILGRIILY